MIKKKKKSLFLSGKHTAVIEHYNEETLMASAERKQISDYRKL